MMGAPHFTVLLYSGGDVCVVGGKSEESDGRVRTNGWVEGSDEACTRNLFPV